MSRDYLPPGIVDYLEKDSVRLGIKTEPQNFNDLELIRKKNRQVPATKGDFDTNVGLAPNPSSTMMMNTIRNDGLETQRFELQERTRIQRRDSDLLENTLDRVGQNLQDMSIDEEVEARMRRPRQILTTEMRSESEQRAGSNMTRVQLQTDLSIVMHNNQITNTSSLDASHRGDASLTNTRRNLDGTSSRISMTNTTEMMVSKSSNLFGYVHVKSNT